MQKHQHRVKMKVYGTSNMPNTSAAFIQILKGLQFPICFPLLLLPSVYIIKKT